MVSIQQTVQANPANSENSIPLLIHLHNAPELESPPGSNATLIIESRHYKNSSATLDGIASFSQVPTHDNYKITALYSHSGGAFGDITEVWGKWNKVAISDITELSFTRNLPYVYNIKVDHANVNTVNPSLEIGEPVNIEVYFKNPSSLKLKSRIVILIKNNDIDKIHHIEKEITIEPQENNGFASFTFIPFDAGEYVFATGIYLKQQFNQWSFCSDWMNESAFHITGMRRILDFAGYQWEVKSGFGNPGQNYWSDDSSVVWIDKQERMHLSLKKHKNRWYASEIISTNTFGYGTYTFFIDAEPAQYDPHVVAGIFLYKDEQNEIDIEFSRWGDTDNYQLGNYVVQPAEKEGNQFRFPIITHGSYTTHRIIWKPEEIIFMSWHGHYDTPPQGRIIAQWQYAGNNIPPEEEGLRVFINLWLFQGITPKTEKVEKLIINHFQFHPLP